MSMADSRSWRPLEFRLEAVCLASGRWNSKVRIRRSIPSRYAPCRDEYVQPAHVSRCGIVDGGRWALPVEPGRAQESVVFLAPLSAGRQQRAIGLSSCSSRCTIDGRFPLRKCDGRRHDIGHGERLHECGINNHGFRSRRLGWSHGEASRFRAVHQHHFILRDTQTFARGWLAADPF